MEGRSCWAHCHDQWQGSGRLSAAGNRFETASTGAHEELGWTRVVDAAQSTTAEMIEDEIHYSSFES